jgi:hypothetical protein
VKLGEAREVVWGLVSSGQVEEAWLLGLTMGYFHFARHGQLVNIKDYRNIAFLFTSV